jgi:opacity protein-like surface antigen
MADLRALALSAVALVALSSAAFAADLLPPPPAFEPAAPISSPEMGGWYIRGDVGVGVNNNMSGTSTPDPLVSTDTGGWFNSSVSDAALFGVGAGYQVNNWFRADLTGELRGGSSFSGLEVVNTYDGTGAKTAQYADFYRGDITTTLAMLNAYADLGTWYGVTPFVGAGVGVAFNRFHDGTDTGSNYIPAVSTSGGILPANTTANLAWALMAGADFSINRNLKLELGYRYLNYGKFQSGGALCLTGTDAGSLDGAHCSGGGYKIGSTTLASNDFRIGLRYYFDSPAPVPPPDVPLVRKY